MRCRHLSLTNFRTYRRLELDLPAGVSVLCGNNAQGKSNLLEALYMLATTKSFRTTSERELVSWHAGADERFARISAEIERQGSTSRLDIILVEPAGGNAANAAAGAAARGPTRAIQKRVRLNQHPRRAMDALGQLNIVLFTPEDVELITGSPAQRRRYLDIMLCQVDPHYLRVLSQYHRVLAQRNALLRQLRDRRLPADQLRYWTEQVVALGSELIVGRGQAITTLNSFLADIHPRLVDDRMSLGIVYRSSVTELQPVLASGSGAAAGAQHAAPVQGDDVRPVVAAQFAAQLDAQQERERRQGVTIVGPHRDDLAFTVDGVDLNHFGSRGQQRTAALAVKLAEAAVMQQRTGERPVLLLDDVLSELDPQRRLLLQEMLTGDGLPARSAQSEGGRGGAGLGGQVLLTTTELRPFTAGFLDAATVFEVADGDLQPVEAGGT